MTTATAKKIEETNALLEARDQFIHGSGNIAVSLLGMLNRVCGQIYALLFLSPKPLSLDDVMEQLGVSKGNVSINIRLLEEYQLVKKVWVKGTRKDYYQAVDQVPTKIIKEFFDKVRRNIRDSLEMIEQCESTVNRVSKSLGKAEGKAKVDALFMHGRLQLVRSFYQNAHLLFEEIYAGRTINAGILKPFLDSP